MVEAIAGVLDPVPRKTIDGFRAPPKPDYDWAAQIFCEVIEEAESAVEAWGGRMVFVYLPSWYRYAGGKSLASTHAQANHRKMHPVEWPGIRGFRPCHQDNR